jgi:hypothetical protein
MTMRRNRIWAAILGTLAVGLGAVVAVEAEPDQPACEEIRAACVQAGFVRGGAKGGDGVMVDCIRPVMQGTFQRPRANKPLPRISSQLVAACKAQDPSFGQRKAPPAQKGAPLAQADPSPPAP